MKLRLLNYCSLEYVNYGVQIYTNGHFLEGGINFLLKETTEPFQIYALFKLSSYCLIFFFNKKWQILIALLFYSSKSSTEKWNFFFNEYFYKFWIFKLMTEFNGSILLHK